MMLHTRSGLIPAIVPVCKSTHRHSNGTNRHPSSLLTPGCSGEGEHAFFLHLAFYQSAFPGKRQTDAKTTAFSQHALYLHCSSHSLHPFFHQGQPQPTATPHTGTGTFRLVKTFPDMRNILWSNTFACIFDLNNHITRLCQNNNR